MEDVSDEGDDGWAVDDDLDLPSDDEFVDALDVVADIHFVPPNKGL